MKVESNDTDLAQVLRLLRFGLLLRLSVVVVGLFATALFNSAMTAALIGLSGAPTVLVLAGTLLRERRRPLTRRSTNLFIAAALIAYVFEVSLSTLLFQAQLLDPASPLRARMAERGETYTDMRFAASAPLFFMLIPLVLGAWLGGRRAAVRWTLFAGLLAMVSTGMIVLADSPSVPVQVGGFLAQLPVIGIVGWLVGTLADQQRARQAELEHANILLAEQAHMRDQLATSRERVRLARDLHDTMAHSLAGLVVQLDAASALSADSAPQIKRQLDVAKSAARRGLAETRAAIGDLRGSMAEDLGLADAIRRYAELTTERGGPPVLMTLKQLPGDDSAIDRLDARAGEALYRIAQEAINNAQRHSGAAQVEVNLGEDAREVVLTVHDDGAGFDPEDVSGDRFGLRGLRERAEEIGARLRVNSAAGRGTEIIVTLPRPTAR